MRICVLHVSDLHFSKDYPDLSLAAKGIGSAAVPQMRGANQVIVALTGDIAFSGMECEYVNALAFVDLLRTTVENGIERAVTLVVIPGNHDVDTVTNGDVRDAIVNSVSNTTTPSSPAIIKTCLEGQKLFRSFVDRVKALPISGENLISETALFDSGDIRIVCTTVNSAWAARSKQAAGSLVFPLANERHALTNNSCYRIGFTHEPANWFRPRDYQQLRAFFLENFSVVFSGHEHSENGERRDRGNAKDCLFYESGALIENASSQSGVFKVITLDFNSMSATEIPMTIDLRSGKTSVGTPQGPLAIPTPKGRRDDSALSDIYVAEKAESHLLFIHPIVGQVHSDELFVEPDVGSLSSENTRKISSIRVALERLPSHDMLLLGDEGAGKTTLSYFAQNALIERGYFAVYVRYQKLANYSKENLDALFEKATRHQFANPDSAWQCPISQRVLILDDIETIDLGSASLNAMLARAKTHFCTVLAVADSTFFAGGAFVESDGDAFKSFAPFEIRKFENRKRHELICKWVNLDTSLTVYERDQKVDFHEARINALIGKNLVPSTPWLVSVCLQNGERPELADLQASGMAQYYQFLITCALSKAQVQKAQLDEYVNFLTQLAGRMEGHSVSRISSADFIAFCADFSRNYHRVNDQHRLSVLREAGIIMRDGDIEFRHSYLYFYFLGSYVARYMSASERDGRINAWATALYKRYNVNALLFLAYHATDLSPVLDATVSALAKCLSTCAPSSLGTDVRVVNLLGSASVPITIPPPVVNTEQISQRNLLDQHQEARDQSDDRASEAAETNLVLQEVLALFSSIDVLGQIAKNYYGSIHRDIKQQMILEVTEASLRAIGFLIETYERDPSVLRSWLASAIDEDDGKPLVDADIDSHVFDFFVFIVAGIATRTAQAISSEELTEDVATVSASKNNFAYRLFLAATQLVRPITIDINCIETLAKDANSNPLVFQSLRQLVIEYVRLFHTRNADRQRICSAVDVSISSLELINFQSRTRKQLPSPT